MIQPSFVGRQKELNTLRDAYESLNSQFIPIYGRRRVGKSEMILHFSKSYPTLYFLAKKAPPQQQMREFLEIAAPLLDEPLLASMSIESWKKTIEAVTQRWRGTKKLILVFDEFQWLAEKSPEITSVLQELWDRSWQKSGRILLILCGSYIGFMEREVLGKRSPLFGRRTGQILLKPFGFREAALFHPHASIIQKAMTYFVCGGIPLYLHHFSSDKSVVQNIEHLFLNEHAPLYSEPNFLLREELREIEKYYSILMALATSSLSSGDISDKTNIGNRSLHYYLDNLLSLGYIGRSYPLVETPPQARHVRYALLDPLLKFWFRFIYPQESLLIQMGSHRAMTSIVQPFLDSYFGHCFELLCQEALPVLYNKEHVSVPFEVGSYWDKNVQIDVVGFRKDGWTDLGECKWGPVKSIRSLQADLGKKMSHYPNQRKATLFPRIFVKNRPSNLERTKDFGCHDLDELYG